MRICDRCYSVDGSAKKATERMLFESTDEEIELCNSCAMQLKEFALNPPKKAKRGRKRVNKATGSAQK